MLRLHVRLPFEGPGATVSGSSSRAAQPSSDKRARDRGDTIIIRAKLFTSIVALKRLIYEQVAVAPESQRLFCGVRELYNNDRLDEGFASGTVLQLQIKHFQRGSQHGASAWGIRIFECGVPFPKRLQAVVQQVREEQASNIAAECGI